MWGGVRPEREKTEKRKQRGWGKGDRKGKINPVGRPKTLERGKKGEQAMPGRRLMVERGKMGKKGGKTTLSTYRTGGRLGKGELEDLYGKMLGYKKKN